MAFVVVCSKITSSDIKIAKNWQAPNTTNWAVVDFRLNIIEILNAIPRTEKLINWYGSDNTPDSLVLAIYASLLLFAAVTHLYGVR